MASKPVKKVAAKKPAAKKPSAPAKAAAQPKKSSVTPQTPASRVAANGASRTAAASVARVTAKPATPVTNATAFKVVSSVERPARVRFSKPAARSAVYPFASVALNDGFFVPAEVIDKDLYASEDEALKAQGEECAKVANRVTGSMRRFCKSRTGFKFEVFTVINGKELGFDADIGIVAKRIA